MNIEKFKSDIIPLRKKLLLFATKMLENEAEAEDTIQETFLRLWNIREQLTNVNNPEGFAMQITKNICIDHIRARKAKIATEDVLLASDNHTPYSRTEEKDSVAIIRQIIEQLPSLQKAIIKMRDIEDYELEEIAAITDTQISAVRVNLSRARKRVREEFIRVNSYKAVSSN